MNNLCSRSEHESVPSGQRQMRSMLTSFSLWSSDLYPGFALLFPIVEDPLRGYRQFRTNERHPPATLSGPDISRKDTLESPDLNVHY